MPYSGRRHFPIVLSRLLASLFLLLLTYSTQLQAVTNDMTRDTFSAWLSHYYLQPEPERIAPMLRQAAEAGVFSEPSKSGPALFGFIAGASNRHPGLAARLIDDLETLDETTLGLVLIGIWYADLPENESASLVAAGLNQHPALVQTYPFITSEPMSLLEVPAERGPWLLDALWGYFFATGSSQPVANIIDTLPWLDASKKDEVLAMGGAGLMLMATSGAARWSLTANARQHPQVRQICEDQLTRHEGLIAEQLQQILNQAAESGEQQ